MAGEKQHRPTPDLGQRTVATRVQPWVNADAGMPTEPAPASCPECEGCNSCGGCLVPRDGELVALLVCEICGREVPARAFVDVDERFDSRTLGWLHHITGGDFL